MDTLSWLAAGLLLISLAFLVLLAAAEAYTQAVPVNRNRLAEGSARGPNLEDALARYMEDRRHLLACLAWGNTAALVILTGSALVLVTHDEDTRWAVSIITAATVIVVASVVQAFPRLLVPVNPDGWALIARPVNAIARALFGVPVTLLEAPARFFAAGRGGADEARRATKEAHDLLRLVEMEEEAGVIEEEEREMIRGVIRMVDTQALEVMVPRTDIIAVEANQPFEEVTRLFIEHGKSRFPLYEETIDNIVGIIYAKEALRHLAAGTRPASLRDIARPPYFIPETKRVDELLAELRNNKVHFAVVVDEYGGTAGIVTIEDLLEEIVGEIEDEYDVAEETIERVSDSELVLDGRVPIEQINEMFGIDIEHEDFDTVGGLVLSELGRIPAPGDEVHTESLHLKVLSVVGRRIKKVQLVFAGAPAAQTVESNGRG